jgi:subtilisin family serine protease
MKLRVVVDKLNIRNALPASLSDKSSVVGIVNKNFSFEGEEVQNLNNPSLGKWYKDSNNLFYWGNGLVIDGAEASAYPEWLKNKLYSIPDLWENNDLSNVKIAILDSGINEHIDFDFKDISGYNYLDNTPNYKTDLVGHGTQMAGIIKASGKKTYGIAPTVKLFVAKVCNDSGRPVLDSVIKALEDIIAGNNGADKVDIINMSFVLGVTTKDLLKTEKIISLLKTLYTASNCILVAASGDSGDEFQFAPAYIDECISVGSVDPSFNHCEFSTSSSTLDIVAPGLNITSSSGTDDSKPDSGTSQSAAIVSGICAYGVSILKKNNNYLNADLKRKLLQTAISSGKDPKLYGFGLVSPNQFIKSLT